MATLSYNGVCLPLPRTAVVRQEGWYDPTGTDLLGTKYTFQVSCVLSDSNGFGLNAFLGGPVLVAGGLAGAPGVVRAFGDQGALANALALAGSPVDTAAQRIAANIAANQGTVTTDRLASYPINPQPPAPTVPFGAGAVGVAGPIGLSPSRLAAIVRMLLSQPRAPLRYSYGNDVYVISPPPSQQILPAGQRCDAKGGPFPRDVRVAEVMGDRLLVVFFTVETYLSDFTNLLLANRFSVHSSTDQRGLTTRTVRGRAVVNLGQLAISQAGNVNITIDSFRKSLLVTCPLGFERMDIDVDVSEDGSVVDYVVVDEERPLVIVNTAFNLIARIEGSYNFSIESSIKSIHEALGKGWETVKAAASLNFKKLGEIGFKSTVPLSRTGSWCRVWGKRSNDNSRFFLGQAALTIAIDRMVKDAQNPPFIVSAAVAYDTADCDFAEARVEAMPTWQQQQVGLFVDPTSITSVMNTQAGVRMGFGAGLGIPRETVMNNGPAVSAANVGFKNGTDAGFRGTWLGALVTAALGIPGVPPAAASTLTKADVTQTTLNPQ